MYSYRVTLNFKSQKNRKEGLVLQSKMVVKKLYESQRKLREGVYSFSVTQDNGCQNFVVTVFKIIVLNCISVGQAL